MKYTIVVAIGIIMLFVNISTRKDAHNLQLLNRVFQKTNVNEAITAKGRQNILTSFSCFNNAPNHKKMRELSNKEIFEQLANMIHRFPVHLLKTKENKNEVSLSVLFNLTEPVVITFKLINENGNYKLNGIDNLCGLFKREDIRKNNND